MVDAGLLTSVLARVVSSLEDDLRVRAVEVPAVGGLVDEQFEAARAAGRTELARDVWADTLFTQVAVGWVLGSVFVRFCEDNGLIDAPLLSGPGAARQAAVDAQTLWFREHPDQSDRGYVEHVFATVAELPGLADVFGSHNPVWLFGPSDDAVRGLLDVWRETDAESGELIWDFTDPGRSTRFLGDLYQDLSESARKQFALLQTPDFVESFILDRTLDPALEEFGLEGFRMIDPACGSGHFLLGAFERLFARWEGRDPAAGSRANAARVLEQVHGVDLNPFAVAIARFRLLVAALAAAGVGRLADAPNFTLNVAAGDALLHGPAPGQQSISGVDEQDAATAHLFATEDGDLVRTILSQKYHAVVANPPYITPKDPAANAAYRRRYKTCHRQYALSVPFMERIFDLAIRGAEGLPAGFTGQITSNSFIKREFGKKLIEQFLANDVDLTHVVDTSGAYIPGHGTPTVILHGRNRQAGTGHVRAVLGIRGEPSRPTIPAEGRVWTSVLALIGQPGQEDEYVSVENLDRGRLAAHPWSLQGGGAGELKSILEGDRNNLGGLVEEVGYQVVTREDDVYLVGDGALRRHGVSEPNRRPVVAGADIRDWMALRPVVALYPYQVGSTDFLDRPEIRRFLWSWRTQLASRVAFGKSQDERGLHWAAFSMLFGSRINRSAIGVASVATHNHFYLERGERVLKDTAPALLLPSGASEDEHLQLLGLLNSSVACFWMKQVFHDKGVGGIGGGIGDEGWEPRYQIDGTKLKQFPVVSGDVRSWASELDRLASELDGLMPGRSEDTPSGLVLRDRRLSGDRTRNMMIGVQEELDWRCLFLYGVTEEDLSLSPADAPPIQRGERAFEIVLARRMDLGEVESSWFERHGSTPVTELPSRWSVEYRDLVERRIALIESDRNVGLVERPEGKRRWNWPDWDKLEREALEAWLLDRLEAPSLWSAGAALSVAELADRLRGDREFVQVAELLAGDGSDLVEVIRGLVARDAVPFLAAHRYKDSGLRKRARWEATWALQRREDAGEDVGVIPVPPKYTSSDFRSQVLWKHRGKLDVAKERFVSYPGLSREADPSLLVGWAGWDHLEQAQALAQLVESRRSSEGWSAERLVPALAGIDELVPWVKQWHNDLDPAMGLRMGDYFDSYVADECARFGIARTDLADWRPPTTQRRRKTKT